VNHVALISSIGEPSSFVEYVWSDAMMEESGVWETILDFLVGLMIDSKIAVDLDL